jgi:ABC-type multidrug transport system fused ATPase/permease subunit
MGQAMQNINLTIEPGETVGFLGATGSGKSSLVNLIPRFYDVTEGRVTDRRRRRARHPAKAAA